MLVLVRLASATFFSLTGVVLLPSVTAFLSVPSYFTATPSRALSWATFTASLSCMPAATPTSWRVPIMPPMAAMPRLPITVAATAADEAPVGTYMPVAVVSLSDTEA